MERDRLERSDSPKGGAGGRRQYLRQVRKLGARHPKRSLKQITERMVFDHLIYLRDTEKLRPSTLNQAVVALRMFFRDYLQRNWKLWEQFQIRRDQPLPVVLTRDPAAAGPGGLARCARTASRPFWF